MKLLTKELEQLLPGRYSQEEKGDAALIQAKFFTPDANWTWYVMDHDRRE